jgi:hypothetical protein
MPRYFFDVSDVCETVDNIGADLGDNRAAWRELVKLAGGCIAQDADNFRPTDNWRFSVRDESGQPLFTLNLCAALSGNNTAEQAA